MTTDAPLAAPALPWWRVERILFDESGWLVVDKPEGLPVHGGDEELADDCVGRLQSWLREQGRADSLFVHQRLDLGTTGCLFFVTDSDHNAEVARAMEAHEIERRYVAVVEVRGERFSSAGGRVRRNEAPRSRRGHGHGHARGQGSPPAPRPLEEEGTLECWLSHERGKSLVFDRAKPDAKRAVTHYRVLERRGARTVLELHLETGRPHQIRASLAHLGYPVVGDRLYGGAGAPRLMLHAQALSGGPLPRAFEAPLPAAFEPLVRHKPKGEAVAPVALGAPSWSARLEDAVVRRAALSRRSAAYRLINGEGDGFTGLTVDAYGPFLSFNVYDAEWMSELGAMAERLLELGFEGAYLKTRVRSDLRKEDAARLAPEGPFAGKAAPCRYLVNEHGMNVGIELGEGLSTGLFVDMRHNRRRMRRWIQEAKRKGGEGAVRMLNLFSYTCSFSVAAALEGAHTTSIDLAGRALARGRDNFQDNGLDPAEHRFFKEDAMKYLEKAVRRGERYDAIVLDPPSFATVKKSTFSVSGRYVEAAENCFRLLQPGGRLLCVTNHLKTSEAAFLRMVRQAADQAGCAVDGVRALPPALDCPPAAAGPFPSRAVVATAGMEPA